MGEKKRHYQSSQFTKTSEISYTKYSGQKLLPIVTYFTLSNVLVHSRFHKCSFTG